MPAVSNTMKIFKSHDPNTFHYTTSVCYNRVPIFLSDKACSLFIEALNETRTRCPFKLIGYVIMPDHTHLIVNPIGQGISEVMRRLKSTSARKILDWLRESNHVSSLRKLALGVAQKRQHTHAVWLKDFSSIRLVESKVDRKSTRLNSSHLKLSRMPSSA